MAQLDPLLTALVERQALELILAEGERPVFRFDAGPRPVSQKMLDRTQISILLAELSDEINAAQVATGQSTHFAYLSPNGDEFYCEVALFGKGLRARVASRESGSIAAPPTPETPPSIPISSPSKSPGESPPVPPAIQTSDEPVAVTAPPPAVTRPSFDIELLPVERMLVKMLDVEASDLHLSASETPMFRIHGEMARANDEPAVSPERMLELLEPIMPEHNRQEFAERNDTDFAHEIAGVARFRVNIFADRKGRGAVFRIIPSKILSAEQLGIPSAVLDLCSLPKGLVLVTGPTGSGKSTTLAAMIDHINDTRPDHIITIEDPIEFVHPNKRCLVNQREVVTHTIGFKPALRAALREDPDIVLVGEMRDLETIAIAIETAETGHLVFGTLHTTTAISTVDRIIDQFPSDRQAQIRTMLSESIRGVVSQTMLKKIGGGRVAALEILIITPAISNLIREGKTFQIPSLMQTGKKYGMAMLNDALLAHVKNNIVEPREAYPPSTPTSRSPSAGSKAGPV